MAKSKDMKKEKPGDFQSLVNAIVEVHAKSNHNVKQAVNYTGWCLGLCRQLFDTYPQIQKSVISEFQASKVFIIPKGIQKSTISKFGLNSKTLLQKLSFTHLSELMSIENSLKRAFYEIECIRGSWSVRELKRQIATLYFERSSLSENPENLSEIVNSGIEQENTRLDIRDPYVFEFLGLRPKDVIMESELEAALVDYALSAVDNKLFVSKYQLELQKKEDLLRLH